MYRELFLKAATIIASAKAGDSAALAAKLQRELGEDYEKLASAKLGDVLNDLTLVDLFQFIGFIAD